ncbi:leucine-rich repeat protein [Faecalibacterium duncaniae]
MKKRFVSLLLAISMILSLMPVSAVTAFAEGENSGAVKTVDSGFCGAESDGKNLSWTLDNNGVLTITGMGAMKDYTWDENVRLDWYVNYKKDIRSVVLDNRITHIGNYAFDKCTNIESVRYTGYTGNAGVALPESVTTIGVHAFSDTGVTGTLKLPEHLTEIDSSAFYHCRKLNGELKLPDTVKEIGGFAFHSCGFTGKLELPASLENIGNDAFEFCSGLTGKLTFPSKMNEIDFSIFHGTGITEVVIPSSIKTVRDFAFESCMNLKKVYLPTKIPGIYNQAFKSCSDVKFYYPAYKADWMTQTGKFIDGTLNTDKDAVKPFAVSTWRPICYYVDVTFDAGSGKFRDGEQQHIVKGSEKELYRTENLTEDMVTAIGTPKQSGYHFAGWSLKRNGSIADVLPVENGYMTITSNGMNEFGGVEDGMILYAVYTSAASVKINGFAADGEEATTIKAGKEHEFTLIGDENTDRGATVTLALNGSTNAKLEYYNSTTEKWQEVTDALNVSAVNGMRFRVAVPKNADNATVTLTAVVKDASGNEIEDGGDSKTFKVNKYVNAEVTITDLDHTTVKAGEAKDFTVSVTPNDDANTGAKATITVSGANADAVEKIQYKVGETWKNVPGEGLSIDEINNTEFKLITKADANDGDVTITVTAKKANGTEIDKKVAAVTVTKKEEPATPGGGSTGGGENPGENPGGNPGSGSTKPEQETPKRKLEIADGTLTSVTVKDENGNLKDITDTITKDLDGKYEIPVGAKVTITAKDAPEGMKFGEWSISDKTLLGDPDVPYTEKDLIFTMPDNPDGVKLSVVYLEESIGEEPNLLEKGALAGTVVVGSAALLYQGHMLGTELYLRYLLPHGAVIPQNRAELAVLLWQDAENPEPVSTTLYSDISDEDSAIQQAARWAVENDLMEQLDADEHPDHFDPFVPVTFSDSIRAWKKAQELKK